MRPVPKSDRVAKLRRLGVSDAVIRLATGAVKVSLFPLLRTPYKVYRGIDWPARGLVFAPLWEEGDVVTAARERGGGTEFFAFSVEDPLARWRLAGSEQGLLATLFNDPVNECYDEPEGVASLRAKLAAAAEAVGFRHLADLDAVYAANYPRPGEALERAYRRFLRGLDAAGGEPRGAEPGAASDRGGKT
jgi:hypothetical protein